MDCNETSQNINGFPDERCSLGSSKFTLHPISESLHSLENHSAASNIDTSTTLTSTSFSHVPMNVPLILTTSEVYGQDREHDFQSSFLIIDDALSSNVVQGTSNSSQNCPNTSNLPAGFEVSKFISL